MSKMETRSELQQLLLTLAVGQLPESIRAIYTMREMGGRSLGAIAKHFGCTEREVRGRLEEAHRLLAPLLAGTAAAVCHDIEPALAALLRLNRQHAPERACLLYIALFMNSGIMFSVQNTKRQPRNKEIEMRQYGATPLSESTDFDLAKAASERDMTAFEEIYHRHRRRVYSICLRMTKNAHEAEDLSQDVFITLYRKVGTFKGESAFTTWLHRLTVNQVLMHFRRRSVRLEKVAENGNVEHLIEVNLARAVRIPIVEKILLENAIDRLPNGYRNVFVLHDVEGYEHEEVAKILDCSVGTSKSQLHKARIALRKLIKKLCNPRILVPVTA